MKSIYGVIIALLACSAFVSADEKAMGIPTYPGAESTMEISLTDEDLLPTLKATLPMLKLGGLQDKISPADLDAALKDVKLIEARQMEIQNGATDAQINDYYTKNAPAGQWSQVLRHSTPKMGCFALFVQNGGEKLYGYRLQSAVEDGKPIKKLIVVRTEGKIDYAKVIAIAAKAFL